ncbi:unnamed protein product [Citrullus colocynthis]|uniref:Uncharacterized protein n=1 Tax=Citrullus colocynthis TaxID=252529 RepID=A0ABP0XRC2_9ROSI
MKSAPILLCLYFSQLTLLRTKVAGKSVCKYRSIIDLRFFNFFHMKIGIKFHDIYSLLISLLIMSVIALPSAVGIISIDFVQAQLKGRLQHFDANTVNSS